jgi:hypothetical protein
VARADVSPRTAHPAKFPKYVLKRLELHVRAEARMLGRPVQVLDPFAGVGRIHDLPTRIAITTGVELEPEWAACRARTQHGDATNLPAEWTAKYDVVATSPCYGSRMADSHEARDSCAGCGGTGVTIDEFGCADAPWQCPTCGISCTCGTYGKMQRDHNRRCPKCRGQVCTSCGGSGLSRRYTYRHALGRLPTEGSAAVMQWGGMYRTMHRAAAVEMRRVLANPEPGYPGGLCLVNMKNHVRDGREQMVTEWWANCLGEVGFHVERVEDLPAPGLRDGANYELRTEVERVVVARAT